MIRWLIDVALRNRFLIIAGFLLVTGLGYCGRCGPSRLTPSPTCRTTR
jgi:hypothetical protein